MAVGRLILLLLLGLCHAQYWDWDDITALDDYVNRDDGYFDLGEPIDIFNEDGADVYLFNMTSQKWMDVDYIDRPIWWHYFAIAIPTSPRILDAAHLYVEGGDNDDDIPDMGTGRMQYIADFARDVGAVAALLRQNPNQPLYFADSPNIPRTEDMIIARTWRHYIESNETNPNPDMILQLPMTKAAKVAVDALVDYSASVNPSFTIDKVMPAGFSKRGWVSWLLACVDPRVFATAPIVLDILNWHPNLHHHYMAYGGWSWAFAAYWWEDVSKYIDHDRSFEIFDDIAIDPLRYNSRMDGMPKLLQIATGDQFFLPDDTHYFWDELTEPKFMCLFENSDHGMDGHGDRLNDNLMNFFVAAYQGFAWPEISWNRIETEEEGTIEVTANPAPDTIQAFWADTTNWTCQVESNRTGQSDECLRDFRLRTLQYDNPILFESEPVQDLGDGNYRVTFPQRDDVDEELGYRGFLVQMTFPGAREGDILDFTTEIHIIPNTFPFEQCSSEEECLGVLK